MASSLHIVIAPGTLFNIGPVPITNTLFTSFLVTTAIVLFAFYANRQLRNSHQISPLQNLLEMIVGGITGLVEDITGGHSKQSVAFMPVIGAFLLFILLNNWAALLPGFHSIYWTGKPEVKLSQVPELPITKVWASEPVVDHNEETVVEVDTHETVETDSADEHAAPTDHADEGHKAVELLRGANSDINMTVALAILSVALTQYFGLKFSHLGYLKKFFNFSSPILFAVGLLELVLELAKILSFGFRLFGNIFAGGVLISVISFLIPVIMPVPFLGIELFVGALQAYVFAMLTLVFFNMAASEHH